MQIVQFEEREREMNETSSACVHSSNLEMEHCLDNEVKKTSGDVLECACFFYILTLKKEKKRKKFPRLYVECTTHLIRKSPF